MSATLEPMLKRLLYQDRVISTAHEWLKGKLVRFELPEGETSVILVFGERQVDLLNVWDDVADCTVGTRRATLLALLERQRLIQLIKQGVLDVEGDPQCIQQFVVLLGMPEFEVLELLLSWVGDVAAKGVTQGAARQLTEALRLLRTGPARDGAGDDR